MRIACALVALLLVPALVSAQRLQGHVADATGPLPGATVTLSRDGALVAGAVTHLDGRFALDARAPGAYRLRVTYVGYTPLDVAISLPAGTTQRDVVLDATDVVAEEAVVEGFARGVSAVSPVTVSNLTAADLEALPAAKDFPVLLATQPSVTFYSENGNGVGYNYLRLRGFDERRVAVSINGLPQNDPEDHAVYWINFMDLQGAVTDVQVQRGAGTAFYGSTGIGGAVNIVADPYRVDRYATLETGYGTYATRQLTAEVNTGLLGGHTVAFVRATHLASDGYREHSWVKLDRLFAGVTRFGARTRWTLQAFGGPQRDALAYYGIPKEANDGPVDDGFGGTITRRSNYGAVSGDVERFNQPQVELRHEWQVRPDVRVEGTAFYTHGAGYFDFDATWRTADYLRLPPGYGALSAEQRALPLYETLPGEALAFRAYVRNDRVGYLPRITLLRGANRYTLGADLLVHRSLHWGRIQETSLSGVAQGEAAAHVVEYRGGKAAAGVYGSALLRPVPVLAVQADLSVRHLRYRLYDEAFFGNDFAVPYTFVNPRVGVTLFPERAVRAYASVAYAEREPRLKNYYDADEAAAGALPLFARQGSTLDFSRPLVTPEKALSVEAGASAASARLRGAATLYAQWFRDEIVPSGGLDQFGVPRTGNAARTRHAGVEGEATARLTPHLVLDAHATASDDRFLRFTEFGTDANGETTSGRRDGHRIASFSAWSAGGALRYEGRRVGARVGVTGAGRTPITNLGTADEALTVDPYALVDASVWMHLPVPRGALRLSFDVNNVLDDKVLLYGNAGGFFPAAERHVYLGLRYTLR